MPSEAARLRYFIAALALVVAACQPVPRPFQPEGKVTTPEPLVVLGPRAGVHVAAIEGTSRKTSQRLRGLLAAGLRDRDVPASSDGSEAKGYVLEGAATAQPISDSQTLLDLSWRLFDPRGEEVGGFHQVKQVLSRDWASSAPALLAFLAEQAAERVDKLVRRRGVERPRAPLASVFVAPVDGAPGDGRVALAAAMRVALERRAVPIADEIRDDAYLVLGSVHIRAAGQGRQSVEVNWTLLDPGGEQIGVVSQRNAVAAGRLDGPWGAIAEAVAEGGAEGVIDILRKVGPIRARASGG
ncbi:MAG: hypothetical protein O7A68_13090 [Alphaproteobacteria bacterium]|nr:hypothetical protein [Alphaproteobacteria bacterium]